MRKKDIVLEEYIEDDTEYTDYDDSFGDDYYFESDSPSDDTLKSSEVSIAINNIDKEPWFLTFVTWFSRLGIAISTVLVLYFIVNGKFLVLILFLISLVASFFFGYGFMDLVEKFSDN